MSNLRKGSTIGGFEIINDKTKSLHTHYSSQIVGNGTSATKDDGPGSNLNVDGLDTYHFNDLENNFVNILGDEINGNLIVDDIDESNPDSAITKNYLKDYIFENNPTIVDYNPYVSIDQYVFDINEKNNTTIEIYPSYVFIKGKEYYLSSQELDISNLSNISNTTVYIFLEYDENNDDVSVDLNKDFFENTDNKIIIGKIHTDGSSQIESIEKNEPYHWLKGHPIVEESLPYGIVMTNNRGTIDRSWLQYKPSLTENISLDGPRKVISGGTYTYTITDYDVFSNYSVYITDGSAAINGDTITVDVDQIDENRHITLTVVKNGNAVDFNIDFISQLNNKTLVTNSPVPSQIFSTWGVFSSSGSSHEYYSTISDAPDTEPFSTWTYNESDRQVIQTQNISSHSGFVSNDLVDRYTHEVTLTSSSGDDDAIGVVIAFGWDGSEATHLSAIITMGGLLGQNILSVVSNFTTDQQQIIAQRQHDTVASSPNSGPGWYDKEIRVKVERDGDYVRVLASKWDDVDNYDPNSEVVLDLNSNSELQQFRGPRRFGYSTRSQPNSTYKNISFLTEKDLSRNVDEVWKKTLKNNGPENLQYGDIVIDKEFNILYLCGIEKRQTEYRFNVYKYDIYNNNWTMLLNDPPQSTFFAAFCKMTIIGDYVYVIGGSNNYNDLSDNGLEASNIMFRINRFNDGFQSMNNIPINVIYHNVTTDGINHIYLVGGMESIAQDTYNDYVYHYDINSDSWEKHSTPIPFENSLKGHICEYYKGRIYVHGMNYSFNSDLLDNSNRGSIFWKYHIVRSEWKVINNNTDINKIYHNSAKYDDKFYIFGGDDRYDDRDHIFYEYYPELDSYQEIASYTHYFEYDDLYDYPLATDRYGYLYIYDYKENSLWRLI